jgi:iron complex transport system ATP-binding protein
VTDVNEPPVIDLHVARYARDGRAILEDVRWRVEAGQHWAVLGANGSGKTSLLNIVAGFEWPSEGSVSVLGERYGACDMPAMKRRVGLVSASLSRRVPAHQRALEVATSGLTAMIGNWKVWTEDELARGREALRRMGAADLEGRPFGVLSEGEKQRTVIARALVTDPALLILDEPCSGLDPAARERLLRDLERGCAGPRGTPVVIVTHHVEEIPAFVTHVLVLRAGRVLARGEKSEVLDADTLGAAFDAECELTSSGGRYSLRIRETR